MRGDRVAVLGDPIAGRLEPLHDRLDLGRERLHPRDHRLVVLLDPIEVLGLGQHVRPAVGLEDHAERVRAPGLVDPDEQLCEQPPRALEPRPQLDEVRALALDLRRRLVEPRLGRAQLLGDRRLALAHRRLLRDQLVHLGVLALDLRLEVALLRLHTLELVDLLLELGRVLGGGTIAERRERAQRREQDPEYAGDPAAGAIVERRRQAPQASPADPLFQLTATTLQVVLRTMRMQRTRSDRRDS